LGLLPYSEVTIFFVSIGDWSSGFVQQGRLMLRGLLSNVVKTGGMRSICGVI